MRGNPPEYETIPILAASGFYSFQLLSISILTSSTKQYNS